MIRMYCSEKDEGAFCLVKLNPEWESDLKFREYPTIMREIGKGAVVSLREMNGYNDSDFYATYWNGEKFLEVEYGTTRFATYDSGATIDATEEIQSLWNAHLRSIEENNRRLWEQAQASLPKVGRTVVIVAGRKLSKGTTGRVFWTGRNNFKTYYKNGYNRPNEFERIGLELESGEKVFIAGNNVKVLTA